jgi:hypothetical protein
LTFTPAILVNQRKSDAFVKGDCPFHIGNVNDDVIDGFDFVLGAKRCGAQRKHEHGEQGFSHVLLLLRDGMDWRLILYTTGFCTNTGTPLFERHVLTLDL